MNAIVGLFRERGSCTRLVHTPPHKDYGTNNATEPYIIDWQVFLPKEVQIDYQHNQQQNLQVLARERGCVKRETNG